jgi:uncharacterized membrane protein YfcA
VRWLVLIVGVVLIAAAVWLIRRSDAAVNDPRPGALHRSAAPALGHFGGLLLLLGGILATLFAIFVIR